MCSYSVHKENSLLTFITGVTWRGEGMVQGRGANVPQIFFFLRVVVLAAELQRGK
jgi:hypothetical protein